MATTDICETLDLFVRNKAADTLAIRGRWGTGKTFRWNDTLKRAVDANVDMLSRYAYISLFGIDGLQAFKQSIFSNAMPKESIGKGLGFEALKDNLSALAASLEPSADTTVSGKSRTSFLEGIGRRLLPALSQIGLVRAWAPFVGDAAFLAVRNHLICIDDFERRGTNLSAGDVLGLVSFLKEQRNCKVVLIFNDDAFDEEAEQRYSEYREKVIDIEVEFEPTVEEATSCVFAAGHRQRERVLKNASALKLTNIRILQRIQRLLDQLTPFLRDKHSSIEDAVIGSIVLFAWSYYSRTTSSVPLDFIIKSPPSPFDEDIEKLSEKKTPEREAQWKAVLKSYGYLYTDELDVALADFMQKGYPDRQRLSKIIAELDSAAKAGNAREEFRNTWDLFNQTFEDNEDALVGAMTGKFTENAKHLSAGDLNGCVGLLRELDRNDQANALIDRFVAAHTETPAIFNVDEMWPGTELDDKIKVRFFEQRGLNQVEKQMEEVVKNIAANDSFSKDDTSFLAAKTVDQYVAFFKATKSRVVYKYIGVLLRFGQFEGEQDYKTIAARTREALEKLASESRLNKIRLRKFIPVQKPAAQAQQSATNLDGK